MEQLSSLIFQFSQFLFPFRQSPPPFPLFRLPLVAYKNVIDLMTSCEQVSLSLCSRKTNSIVKNIRHRPKSLELWSNQLNWVEVATGYLEMKNIRRNCSPLIKATGTSPDFDPVETVMIRGYRVPVKIETDKNGEEYLETYWNDENVGLRMIADYVCDLFRVNIFSIWLRNDHRRMFDWLRNRQSFVNALVLGGRKRISDEDYRYVISESNSYFLEINAKASKSFRMENLNKKLEAVTLLDCPWITIDNLMTVDARRINVLPGKLFTNQDVNRFLKHWMKGGSPRLKQIEMDLVDWNEEAFLADINVQEGAPGERLYTGFYEINFNVTNTVHLVREDGIKASFGISSRNLFFLAVWPDSTGRTFECFD
uniref:FBA_2 domain-containing protein n=2 Tax=Caenorhabditis tropicalis TaxID=1561998 RepID=A0A1I7UVX1_9PELO